MKPAEGRQRTEIVLPTDLLKQIDAVAGKRGRTKFLEQAARAELRRGAVQEWFALGNKLKGLTLQDTLYEARRLEERRR
ncbi:MAG TPA: hypothetical protein ENN53_02010 [Candidatus Acetothermia bacterium]|nr:hypothetical protein [Candidatus Acetothermia bacterium]